MSQTVKVVWEIDAELNEGESTLDVVQRIADDHFQSRIVNGEPGTACVFNVVYPQGHSQFGFNIQVDLSVKA